MTIPDAAVEAGADVARTLRADPLKYPTDALLARSVIEAAMPAIREALAQEIRDDDDAWRKKMPHREETDRYLGFRDGIAYAALVVEGGPR